MQRRVISFGSWGEKMYCLSSLSKKGQPTIAEYIRKIIIRVAKSRPIFRNEYAVIAFKLAQKHCINPDPTLNSLGCFDNFPSNTLGYGRLLPTGRFEIWHWDIDAIKIAEANFCLINKHKCCRQCFIYLGLENALCKKCDKILTQHYRDTYEAKELRSLTRKLEKVCNEKNKNLSEFLHHYWHYRQ